MKRQGFTLAEVLITLGIIGVVAALTTPALISDFNNAKTGPTLRKFMSTMENAHQQILAANEASRLSAVTDLDAETYFDELSKYVAGSTLMETKEDVELEPKSYDGTESINMTDDGPIFRMKGGDDFYLSLYDRATLNNYRNEQNGFRANGAYKGTFAVIFYDINGVDVKPNRLGKDIFRFNVDDTGAMIPNGGKLQVQAYGKYGDKPQWEQNWARCDEDGVYNGHSCAGSIMDNDWKVVYQQLQNILNCKLY